MSPSLPPTEHAQSEPVTRTIYLSVPESVDWHLDELLPAPGIHLAIVQTQADVPADADWLRIEGLRTLPVQLLSRLLRHHRQVPNEILCTLATHGELALAEPGSLSAAASNIDAYCAAFASGERYQVRAAAQAPIVFIPAAARTEYAAGQREFWWLCSDIYADGAPSASASPSAGIQPWHALGEQILQALAEGKPSTWLSDARPRRLHILHNWGGGVERFALDFAAADPDRRHLWLIAEGAETGQTFGRTLRVVDPGDGLLLYQAPISPPIQTLDLSNPSYTQILQLCLARFAISEILLSSLIGHALDALRTGLPTVVVLHDYFPLWPKLDCDFGDARRRFDAEELGYDAANSPPFARATAQQWSVLSRQYQDALLQARAQLVAPSHAVLANVQRIAPALAVLPSHVIGHGCAPWPQSLPVPPWPRQGQKLRVLVPGRIGGGKGDALLWQAMPQLLEHVELILLGAKAQAHAFLAHAGVHIIMDYQWSELPRWIAQLQPDLALLPRTIAETYSYSLSEMRALGVPVLATRTGALSERIVDGESGFLCEPNASALLQKLADLAQQPELLTAVRARLADTTRPVDPTLMAQIAAYAACYHQAESGTRVSAPAASEGQNQLGILRSEMALQTRALRRSQAALKAAQAQSIERGEWGTQLQRTLNERSAWAHRLKDEVERLGAQILETQAASEAQQLHLQGIIEQTHIELQARADALERQQQHVRFIESQLAAENARYQELIHSSSWRLTRPLRVLARFLRGQIARLRFYAARAKTLVARGITSLRTRGFSATLQRVLRRHEPVLTQTPLSLPETPEQFVPYQVDGLSQEGDIAVSIVIPVYNKFHYTDVCLRAISAATSRLATEVIVVDDCSTDASFEYLQQIGGIRAIRNQKNLGFIGACNAGLAAARGEFVVFLNNDTAVQAGWLEQLIATFDLRPDAGLVGSMLIYPDGRLQESGGIIFKDGSGWNYGRFDDPAHPQYGFVREVDYCSGAAIALRRSLLEHFGGFDTLYTPAYYEDTDLAFKVRAAGLKCYVQPASKVVHFEGISSGTDLHSGIKRFQLINQEKFLARWAEVLATHPPAPPAQAIAQSAQHRARRWILVVDAVTPMPDQDSGSLRMINLLRLLVQEGCAVSFFCEGRHYHEGYAQALQQLGVEILYHPYLSSEPAWLKDHGARFDAVLLSRHYVAGPLLSLVREHCRRARVIFDTVDLHFLREQRQAELAQDRVLAATAEKTKQQELAIIAASDLTLVVSPIEKQLLAQLMPQAPVDILSNIHDIPGSAADFEARADLLFVGGFQHPPNVDAVLWFVREVFDRVRLVLPEVRLHLVGSNTPPEILALASEAIVVHGFVKDIDPLLASARLSIAPLRYGAGVKGKVNMAMAHGLPVIATPCAVEGMYCQPELDVLVGESPEQYAEALLRCYQQPELWRRISAGGLANVRTHFSFEAAQRAVKRIFALS